MNGLIAVNYQITSSDGGGVIGNGRIVLGTFSFLSHEVCCIYMQICLYGIVDRPLVGRQRVGIWASSCTGVLCQSNQRWLRWKPGKFCWHRGNDIEVRGLLWDCLGSDRWIGSLQLDILLNMYGVLL